MFSRYSSGHAENTYEKSQPGRDSKRAPVEYNSRAVL